MGLTVDAGDSVGVRAGIGSQKSQQRRA